MRFTLRLEHVKIHKEFRERRKCAELTVWLDKEYPELFRGMTNEERHKWTSRAIKKAIQFEFDDNKEYVYTFSRILARIGTTFDNEKQCEAITGILKNDLEFTGNPIIKTERLKKINEFLDFIDAKAIGTRKNSACNCEVPDYLRSNE